MSFLRLSSLAFLALTLVACDQRPPAAPSASSTPAAAPAGVEVGRTNAQPRLQTSKLLLGLESQPVEITAEIALQDDELMAGLMYRTNMPENEGMLFVFPRAHQASFWMKNTILPLSIAYIDETGIIREIHDMQPRDTNSTLAETAEITFALEMNQGWFQRHHVKTGTVVRTDQIPLKQAFPSPIH